MSSAPCLADTDCIQLSLDGDSNLVATIVVSPDDGNLISCKPNGLFAAAGASPLVTTFPDSPTDGEEVVYAYDEFTDWLFRYDAAESSSYKWKWLGGPPALAHVDADDTITSPGGVWGTGTPAGPSITLPFAGYYTCRFGANIAATNNGFVSKVGPAKVGDDPDTDAIASSGNENLASVMNEIRLPFDGSAYGTPGTVIRLLRYSETDTGSSNFQRRWMAITPRKVT